MENSLLIALVIAFMGQTGVIWRKLGRLESAVKNKTCPFGSCPLYERAKQEAAPERNK